jgi:hypothetical protein
VCLRDYIGVDEGTPSLSGDSDCGVLPRYSSYSIIVLGGSRGLGTCYLYRIKGLTYIYIVWLRIAY